MITRLRAQLIILFVSLVVLIYAADSLFSYFLVKQQLTLETQDSLGRMCEEILPSVTFINGEPSLQDWYQLVLQKHIHITEAVQLFDKDKHLIEQYGLAGVPQLKSGHVIDEHTEKKAYFYSRFLPINGGGFVQIQITSQLYDKVIQDYTVTKFTRILIIALAIGICSWFYSGKAIDPVVRSLETLRKFVDDAGHELNTPVTLIEQSVETLEAHFKDQNMPTDMLEIIQRASKRLKTLANDLLLLAKMEYPEVIFHKALANHRMLIESVVDELKEKAHLQKIDLQIQQANSLSNMQIWVDKQAMSRVFSNLIDNAIRYTAPGGKIDVYFRGDENSISTSIQDTGVGIPADSLPYLFDRFYRVDKARSRPTGGSGLGLAIVKAIVDAHNGQVKVESQVGKGSTFTVSLPIVT